MESFFDEPVAEMRTEEAGAAGNEDFFHEKCVFGDNGLMLPKDSRFLRFPSFAFAKAGKYFCSNRIFGP
jgi:hypothetical protein